MKSLLLILSLMLTQNAAHASHAETDVLLSDFDINPALVSDDQKAILEQSFNEPPSNELPAPETVTDATRIQIVGKGFSDGKHGDSIALACVGPIQEGTTLHSCMMLRHVYFNHLDQTATYVGDTYRIWSADPTAKDIKDKVNELNSDFKKYKRDINHNQNFFIFAGVGVAGILTIWFASPASWAISTTGMPLTVGVAAIFIATWSIIGAIYNANGTLFASSAGSSDVFYDKNGWNWVTHPKKVSHSTFKMYRQFLGLT